LPDGQTQGRLHLIIIEGADGHCAQLKRHRLQQQILGCMPSLQPHVTFRSLTILGRRPFVHGSHDEDSRRRADGLLTQRGITKRRPPFRYYLQLRLVAVSAPAEGAVR